MTPAGSRPILVLDAGALIALERSDRRMLDLVKRVRAGDNKLLVPDAVLAQVWRDGRGRQARLAWLLGLDPSQCRRVPLDTEAAKRIGALIAASGHADVVDAHVAIAAIDAHAAVITSDRADILRAAPQLRDRIVDI